MNVVDQVAAELEEQIRKGAFLAGKKLPSVRQEATSRGISPTTMAEVYELLKVRGVIESRPRSGYFVLLPRQALTMPEVKPRLLPSASLDPEDLLQDMLAAGNDKSIFPFGAAIPSHHFVPSRKLQMVMQQVMRENPGLFAEYGFPPGSESLRQTLVRRYQRMGVKGFADNIVVTNGAIEAVGLALGVIAEPGATIAVETPTYPGIFRLARTLGYRILEIPVHPGRGLTPEALDKAISKGQGKLKAVVTVANFSNPLGSLVSDEDKAGLVALASKKGIALIEDDVYGDLAFSGKRSKPLKAFDKTDCVFLCSSFVKTISPLLRCGFVMNRRYASALTALKYARGSGSSALSQEVLNRFLEEGHYERQLARVRSTYRNLVATYSQQILALFPEGTRVSQPQGGFVLWIELPHEIDGGVVQKQALGKRISIAPGSIFSECGLLYRNFIRLNCAIPWSDTSARALKQLAGLVRET